jgi:hypothetical protein
VPPATVAAPIPPTTPASRWRDSSRNKSLTWSAVLVLSIFAGIFCTVAFSILGSDKKSAPSLDSNFYNNLSNLAFYIAAFLVPILRPSRPRHFVTTVVLMLFAVLASFLSVVVYPFSMGTALWANFTSQLAQLLSMVYLID